MGVSSVVRSRFPSLVGMVIFSHLQKFLSDPCDALPEPESFLAQVHVTRETLNLVLLLQQLELAEAQGFAHCVLK